MKRSSQIFGVISFPALLLVLGLSISASYAKGSQSADSGDGPGSSLISRVSRRADNAPRPDTDVVTRRSSAADETTRNELKTSPDLLKAGKPIFDPSRVNTNVIEAFQKAWRISKAGTSAVEGVVLVFQNADGSYTGKSQGHTNQYKAFTFTWDPQAIAIVHTHPNTTDPRPQPEDMKIADRFRVPMLTITSRGMYMYDPATKKTTKLLDGLDWLDRPQSYAGLQQEARSQNSEARRLK